LTYVSKGSIFIISTCILCTFIKPYTMSLIAQLQQLDRLNYLIRRKATGSPDQLADRLGCSRRTVYNLLKTLRELGAEIHYCTERPSYYYEKPLPVDLGSLLKPDRNARRDTVS